MCVLVLVLAVAFLRTCRPVSQLTRSCLLCLVPNALPRGHPDRKEGLLNDPSMANYYRGTCGTGC